MLQMAPETSATNENEQIERRLIAAFIHPEPGLREALYRDGMSERAAQALAVRMGLTTQLIRNCRLNGLLPEMRSCIQCDMRFLSAGRHNRRCKRCLSR
jgi:hypothetical protein